jgi:transposase InsO family protein
MEFATKAGARLAVDQGIWLYNTKRPHAALNYRIPAAVHQSVLN